MYQKIIGRFGENVAKQYLLTKSYKILATNWRYKKLEIDIIAYQKTVIAVEVKTRKSLITPPQSILSRAQVGRLRVALKNYCLLNKLSYKSSRLDLIVITPKSKQSVCLKHHQDV